MPSLTKQLWIMVGAPSRSLAQGRTRLPSENRELARRIVNDRGAIITEYGLGVKPDAKNFPPRNRIISGLSLGVVVVEAGERSGASITAKFALEQGRDVFAVPGNINSPASKGTNRLIQEGAKLITRVDDVLEELNLAMVLSIQQYSWLYRIQLKKPPYLNTYQPSQCTLMTLVTHLDWRAMSSAAL